MLFSIIVAADMENGIGIEGKLPWRLKGDMAFFKKTTTTVTKEGETNVVVMGRKTWESIPEKFRPLPNRINIVLSRHNVTFPGATTCHSFDEISKLVGGLDNVDRVFVIGGAEIYNLALKQEGLQEVYLTRVSKIFGCDTFMDELDESFCEISCVREYDEENHLHYSFETWRRQGCCM